ncbi:MFS transporter, partial [Actinotignum timonense]|nr:MFS transporter [Actinotignum timonense]
MENTRYFTIPGSDRTYDRNKLLVVLIVALVMSFIQVSSVNNLLPIIETGLNAGRGDIQWVLSGYSLAFGLLLVPAGRMGDIFGRSSLWMIGMAVFTLGSLLCGLASDALILNIARALQGIGSGIFSPQVTGMIMQYFDGHARAKAFAYMGLAISASVAVGPLLSGSLVQLFGPVGWRWSFILNVPLGLLGLGLGIFLLPFLKERRAIGDDAARIDAAYRA